MKKIHFTNNKELFAIVDDEYYIELSKYTWHINVHGYAIRNKDRAKMHRIIIDAPKGKIVDHINRIKTDNRRQNLRIVTKEENVHNQKKRTGTKNNYKGTKFIKRLGLWESRCRMMGQLHVLGVFKSEISAAYAYNKKAAELSSCCLLNQLPYTNEELEILIKIECVKQKKADRTSEYYGVYWCKRVEKWAGVISIGKKKQIGYYNDEIKAAEAVAKYIKKQNIQVNKIKKKLFPIENQTIKQI
jgi:hypothetical protein